MSNTEIQNDAFSNLTVSTPLLSLATENSLVVFGSVSGTTNYMVVGYINDKADLTTKINPTSNNFTIVFNNLSPNTIYSVQLKIFDLDILDEELSITFSEKVSFKTVPQKLLDLAKVTLQTYETTASYEEPRQNKPFKVYFRPSASTNIKYKIFLIVNCKIIASKVYSSIDFSSETIAGISYFTKVLSGESFNYKLNYGDLLQIGIQVCSNNSTLDPSSIIGSNAILLKEPGYLGNRVYLKTKKGFNRVSIFKK
jgi:hypothetical protein